MKLFNGLFLFTVIFCFYSHQTVLPRVSNGSNASMLIVTYSGNILLGGYTKISQQASKLIQGFKWKSLEALGKLKQRLGFASSPDVTIQISDIGDGVEAILITGDGPTITKAFKDLNISGMYKVDSAKLTKAFGSSNASEWIKFINKSLIDNTFEPLFNKSGLKLPDWAKYRMLNAGLDGKEDIFTTTKHIASDILSSKIGIDKNIISKQLNITPDKISFNLNDPNGISAYDLVNLKVKLAKNGIVNQEGTLMPYNNATTSEGLSAYDSPESLSALETYNNASNYKPSQIENLIKVGLKVGESFSISFKKNGDIFMPGDNLNDLDFTLAYKLTENGLEMQALEDENAIDLSNQLSQDTTYDSFSSDFLGYSHPEGTALGA